MFGAGLGIMGDLYASPTATAVLRIDEIPPRPSHLEGAVRVCGVASAGKWDVVGEVRGMLESCGALREVRSDGDDEVVAIYEVHADAEFAASDASTASRVVSTFGEGSFVMLEYNDRPTSQRGWVIFEEAVSCVCSRALDPLTLLACCRTFASLLAMPLVHIFVQRRSTEDHSPSLPVSTAARKSWRGSTTTSPTSACSTPSARPRRSSSIWWAIRSR